MPLAQTIGLETLSKYFHLPINDVAKELGVCATVLKKICRKNGIPRWPHRKIKSLDKMIMTLEVSVAKNPEDGERIRHEIHTLKNKKMFLMKNPNVLATKAPNMKKGMKAQKGDKSPIDSPESPTRSEHPHPSYHPYAYPYAAYAEHAAVYAHHPYAGYMYNNPAMKGVPPAYAYYPYPPHYPEHMMDHRRPGTDSDECLSPSMVLDPVAAALFLQIPHPHIPHPSNMPRLLDSPQSGERPQWVPNDHSAFASKSLRPKLSPTAPPPGYHPDLFAEQQQAHMVPQHSPHAHLSPQHVQHPLHSPSHHSPPPPHHTSGEYLIQLPELRLPEEKEPRKLSTLEPLLFRQNSGEGEAPSSPSSATPPPPPPPPPSNKWQLPEWFEAERKDSQQRNEKGTETTTTTTTEGEVCVPSYNTPPPPLTVGE